MRPQIGSSRATSTQEDHRLERLYDYTKFHIGIYLSSAGGLTTAIATLASDEKKIAFIRILVGSPLFLGFALFFMIAAGACAGIVATSVTESKNFEMFWDNPQGPAWLKNGPKGSWWVGAEHFCFWLSLLCLIITILSKKNYLAWLMKISFD